MLHYNAITIRIISGTAHLVVVVLTVFEIALRIRTLISCSGIFDSAANVVVSLQGGTDVVDPNCQVYGTSGLFITDGSLSPAMTTSNPVQMIMAFGEICASKVLAL